jgi:hypothetical protein
MRGGPGNRGGGTFNNPAMGGFQAGGMMGVGAMPGMGMPMGGPMGMMGGNVPGGFGRGIGGGGRGRGFGNQGQRGGGGFAGGAGHVNPAFFGQGKPLTSFNLTRSLMVTHLH